MNIELEDPAFYNGFDYFCPTCATFFSISGDYTADKIEYCPACGMDGLFTDYRELAEWCRGEDVDTAEYWEAFPPDEPLPHSQCAATPRQIRKLFWAAAENMRMGRMVSVDDLYRETGIEKERIQSAVNLGTIKYEYLERGIVERLGRKPRACRCPIIARVQP
jgi:hypothetical protein